MDTVVIDEVSKTLAALPKLPPPKHVRSSAPAVKVLDCVLSLNHDYEHFVIPRLRNFIHRYPDVRSINELQELMASFPSVNEFCAEVLSYSDPRRAQTFEQVVTWVAGIATTGYTGTGDWRKQANRLSYWATTAQPGDFAYLSIPGFGLSGFQGLRMLAGANTVRPSDNINRFVEKVVGQKRVSPVFALKLLELAAYKANVFLPALDLKKLNP